jgi:hypothetical protein
MTLTKEERGKFVQKKEKSSKATINLESINRLEKKTLHHWLLNDIVILL